MQIQSTDQQGFPERPFDYMSTGEHASSRHDDLGAVRGVAMAVGASALVYALIARLLFHIF